jgi:kynurenine formamidase
MVSAAAALVRRGAVFSLAMAYDSAGPQVAQLGITKRTNPVHVMTRTGVEAEQGLQTRPHGFGSSDDMVVMFLQCGTQWDGLGHIFDHGQAWNGRQASIVTTEGDQVTGVQHLRDRLVGRGVLLDLPRALGQQVLPDGFPIGVDELERTITHQGPTSAVRRGDLVMVRTGQLGVRRREGWGDFAGGAAPGLSFSTIDWIFEREIAAVASDTWGLEVRPNELPDSFMPLHQVVIPHMGLLIGEMFDLDELAEDCAADSCYEFLLVAGPLPFTGAVGSPLNPLALK